MIKNFLRKNWWVLLVILGCVFAYSNKYTVFSIPVVSNPDSTILFSTDDVYLEQTWQPNVKKINGIRMPYVAKNGFSSDIQLTIFSDDYSQELIQITQKIDFSEKNQGTIEFAFDNIDVIVGERYHIQLYFQNTTEEGLLEFATGSNYAGCSIGEEEINEALAICVDGVKNSKIFWIVAVLFPLSAISLLFMVLFGRKWEETVGTALILEGLLLYLFGLAGYIKWGINAIYLLSMIAFGIAVYIINQKEICFKNLLSPGFWIFWLLFGLIILGNQESVWYGRFDEYSHWGLAVKDMFYYDSFAKHIDTTVLLPRYLPFVTLIEYYYVYLNGIYVESIVYIAFQVIMLSCLIILCKPINKNKMAFFPIALGMICVPPFFFYDVSSSIYVDPLLGFLTMYILICFFSKENTVFPKIQIISGLMALVLVKDMGVVLAGLMAIVFVADTVWTNIKLHKKYYHQLAFSISGVAVTVLTWISWQIYMSIPVSSSDNVVITEETAGVSFKGTVEASGLSVDGILKLITGNGSDDQKQIIKNALVRIFDDDMYYLGNVGFSYVDIILVCILIVGGLILLRFWKNDKDNMFHLIWLLSISGVIYCSVLCIMYLFAFSTREALKLESIERYLGSFLVAEVLAICYFIIAELCNWVEKKEKVQFTALLLSVVFLIIMPMNNYVVTNRDRSVTADMVYWCEETEEIFRSFAKRGEYSAFACANAGTESYFIFRNSVSPVISERTNLNVVSSEEIANKQIQWYIENGSEKSVSATVVTLEEWKNYLANCDYLFVLHADDFFIDSYQTAFLEPETISDGSMYRVLKESDNVRLAYIGKTGIKKYR